MKRLKFKKSFAILLSAVMASGAFMAVPLTVGAAESADSACVSAKSSGIEFDTDAFTMPTDALGNIFVYDDDYDYYDGTLTWSSGNEAVATVKGYTDEEYGSVYGVVTSLAPGTAVITAVDEDGCTASCTVTVKEKAGIDFSGVSTGDSNVLQVELDSPAEYNLLSVLSVLPESDDDDNYWEYSGSVTWTSSDESVAVVEPSEEYGGASACVTPVSCGTAVITATTADGVLTCTAEVNKIFLSETEITADVGSVYMLMHSYMGAVTWTSSDASVAAVTPYHITREYSYANVTAAAPGTAVITVTTADGYSASCTITVLSDEAYKLGDVNGDGDITISDVTDIQKSIAQITVLTDEQEEAADVNGDGKVDITDATVIQKYIAQIITELPAAN